MDHNDGIHHYYKLYKPYGYLSQFDSNSKQQQKKKFLSELYSFEHGTMPIGRLDEDSEGLLLLTTDGKLSDTINKGAIEKEYYVQLDGDIDPIALQKLRNGVEIGIHGKKYVTQPCDVRKLNKVPSFPERSKKIRDSRHGPTSWVSITLSEGKFRQIRKMTSSVGCPTLRLVRIRVGEHVLGSMQPSEVIKLESI
jgi:23S rRNA pseudouridine2457 synthase